MGSVYLCVYVCVGVCMFVCVCTCARACAFSCANDENKKKTEKQKKKERERKKERRRRRKFDVLNVSQHRIPRRAPLNTSVSVDARSPASNVKRFTYFSFPFPRCSVD